MQATKLCHVGNEIYDRLHTVHIIVVCLLINIYYSTFIHQVVFCNWLWYSKTNRCYIMEWTACKQQIAMIQQPLSYHDAHFWLLHPIIWYQWGLLFSGGNSTNLYHFLFDDYTHVRPVTVWTDIIQVSLQFALYQVKSLVSMYSFQFMIELIP